jgi:hypothetical protein
MDLVLQLLLGVLIAIALHELTHLFIIIYYKIPFKAIVITKWSAIGFLVDNETYVTDNKKLFLLHFSPMLGCLVFFINPNEPFYLMFPVVNIFGGIGDFYNFFKLIVVPPQQRIDKANDADESVLKSIIWRKDIRLNKKIFNEK